MGHRLTEKDRTGLQITFPSLNCDVVQQQIWGTLSFACSFEPTTQRLHHAHGPSFIEDDYEIRINYLRHDTFGLPLVREESGFIAEFAARIWRTTADVHLFDDGTCCLGIDPMYHYTTAEQFIYDKVIPFFYWQSFLREFGEEPWSCYSHNVLGLCEAMTLKTKDFRKSKYRNKKCMCQSGKKYKYCCLGKDEILWNRIQSTRSVG